MTIANTRLNQSSTRSYDNANSFFRVQRGLNSKSRWNKTEIFAAVVEPELSKRQSLTTVLLRTPITQMIFFNQGVLLLGSNHFITGNGIKRTWGTDDRYKCSMQGVLKRYVKAFGASSF